MNQKDPTESSFAFTDVLRIVKPSIPSIPRVVASESRISKPLATTALAESTKPSQPLNLPASLWAAHPEQQRLFAGSPGLLVSNMSTLPSNEKKPEPVTTVQENTTVIMKHVCGYCGKTRSPNYHSLNPLAPGEVPKVGFCGRCVRERTPSETSANDSRLKEDTIQKDKMKGRKKAKPRKEEKRDRSSAGKTHLSSSEDGSITSDVDEEVSPKKDHTHARRTKKGKQQRPRTDSSHEARKKRPKSSAVKYTYLRREMPPPTRRSPSLMSKSPELSESDREWNEEWQAPRISRSRRRRRHQTATEMGYMWRPRSMSPAGSETRQVVHGDENVSVGEWNSGRRSPPLVKVRYPEPNPEVVQQRGRQGGLSYSERFLSRPPRFRSRIRTDHIEDDRTWRHESSDRGQAYLDDPPARQFGQPISDGRRDASPQRSTSRMTVGRLQDEDQRFAPPRRSVRLIQFVSKDHDERVNAQRQVPDLQDIQGNQKTAVIVRRNRAGSSHQEPEGEGYSHRSGRGEPIDHAQQGELKLTHLQTMSAIAACAHGRPASSIRARGPYLIVWPEMNLCVAGE